MTDYQSLGLKDQPGVKIEDSISTAGKKVFEYYFDQLIANIPSARIGEDIEAIHDVRVAIRRLRVAGNIFGKTYQKQIIKPLRKQLKVMGGVFGVVRDTDVFIENSSKYLGNGFLDIARFQPMTDYMIGERLKVHKHAVAYLDDMEYVRFIRDLEQFVRISDLGVEFLENGMQIFPLNDFVPQIISKQLDKLKNYNEINEYSSYKILHQLRIDGKKLRYALEFFTEILGTELEIAIKLLKELQDCLGDINDVNVAAQITLDGISQAVYLENNLLRDLFVQYQEIIIEEKISLMKKLPEIWENYKRPEFEHLVVRSFQGLDL
ncbi:CHAD domain-containing protein [Chloroflexota bacterium]